jgi:ubiquinone/menaquinone biosynthesis C-methylase UbiE
MDKQHKKAKLKETFNIVSEGYDNRALRFFPDSARLLAKCLGLRGNEHVLDVATGTGHAALAIAGLVPQGRVLGADFSSGMLDRARQKAASLSISNVEFLEMDMQVLEFTKGLFDVAVCAFGIFFVEDMGAQVTGIAAAVKPGGTIAISGFQENTFRPLADLMFDRLDSYGVQKPPQTWQRIDNKEKCIQLFEKAGIRNIRVEQKNVGYFLNSSSEWWDVVWNAGFRGLVNQLPPGDQKRFKREHMKEIEALRTKDGIWLDVGVLYTIGTKP